MPPQRIGAARRSTMSSAIMSRPTALRPTPNAPPSLPMPSAMHLPVSGGGGGGGQLLKSGLAGGPGGGGGAVGGLQIRVTSTHAIGHERTSRAVLTPAAPVRHE